MAYDNHHQVFLTHPHYPDRPGVPVVPQYSYPNSSQPNVDLQYRDCATPAIATLATRVAVLEAELQKAQADKVDADNAIKYLLRVQSTKATSNTDNVTDKQVIMKLRAKLIQVREEKQSLKETLSQVMRVVSNLSQSSTVPKEGKTTSFDIKATDTDSYQHAENVLLDLLDSNETTLTNSFDSDNSSLLYQMDEEERTLPPGITEVENAKPLQDPLTTDLLDLSDDCYVFRFAQEDHDSLKDSTAVETNALVVRVEVALVQRLSKLTAS